MRTAAVASAKAQPPSGVTTRAKARPIRARAAVESEGWEEELEREKKPPTSSQAPFNSSMSLPSTSPSPPRSPLSLPPLSPPLSSASSPTSVSPSVSPPSSPPSFSRPPSSSSSYRSSFGRPHGSTASALTVATTSLASELSHLEDHPAFASLTQSLHSLPFLSSASTRLGLGELPLALLLALSGALAFIWGVGVMGAVDLLLFLYPAYLSYHALEANTVDVEAEGEVEVAEEEEGEAEPEVRHWLLYWTLYGGLSLVWRVTDVLWGEGYVYWVVRTGVGVALVVERWRLCEVMWEWVVWPVWRVNEAEVEGAVDRVIEEVGRVWEDSKALLKEGVVWWLRGGGDRKAPPTSSVLSKPSRRRVR